MNKRKSSPISFISDPSKIVNELNPFDLYKTVMRDLKITHKKCVVNSEILKYKFLTFPFITNQKQKQKQIMNKKNL